MFRSPILGDLCIHRHLELNMKLVLSCGIFISKIPEDEIEGFEEVMIPIQKHTGHKKPTLTHRLNPPFVLY